MADLVEQNYNSTYESGDLKEVKDENGDGLRGFSGKKFGYYPYGSFAMGTAIPSSSDIDLVRTSHDKRAQN